MGFVAARALGSGCRARLGLYLFVQHSIRNGSGRLYAVGSAAGAVATGIRRTGGISLRIVWRAMPARAKAGAWLGFAISTTLAT